MRLVFDVSLEKNTLPLEYRRIIISFIKSALAQYEGGRFYNQFYGGCVVKNFSFGVQLGKATFKDDCIILENGNIKLVLTINNDKEGIVIFNSLMGMGMRKKKFSLGDDNSLVLEKVSINKEVEIKESSVMFKLISPLCLREHNPHNNKDYYYSIKSDKFIEKFKTIVRAQIPKELKPYVENMQVVPIDCKKTVVKHYGQKIEVTIGVIAISAEILLLSHLYKSGVGSRKSAGFGLLDIVGGVK
ncbi:MAG: CRISPR-associated endoribonuclease Cas6 [Alkaliphilus sp.]|nr:CRISPR-associated endoribonuclease Cas6 [Alkaliphilus sp. AH-315-G20]MBN4070011.1 CRISPR-associated endoribonuclease Cas6 [bacterium AH-315-G05]PHS32813.1 MAG: CRISPR-associated endoribonuclease Cas6 [Alkaliphilus sp.]